MEDSRGRGWRGKDAHAISATTYPMYSIVTCPYTASVLSASLVSTILYIPKTKWHDSIATLGRLGTCTEEHQTTCAAPERRGPLIETSGNNLTGYAGNKVIGEAAILVEMSRNLKNIDRATMGSDSDARTTN